MLGFIERSTRRVRGYLVPNCKSQTVVQYLAKTVAKNSVIYTPFYAEHGWEFLDKYYEHKRLITAKGESYEYQYENVRFGNKSGFTKLWQQLKMLETTWLKSQ